MNALTKSDRARLAVLEQQIQTDLGGFLRVGAALLEIQQKRLYRGTHATWDAYCQERWGMGKSHAYRLIQAAEVAEDVSPIGEIANESQARELVPLDTDQRRQVWDEATQGGTQDTTAARLRELSAKALASLPPEEQREAIELSEREILHREHSHAHAEDTKERKGQIDRLAHRLRKLHAGLVDIADEADARLDAYLEVIGRAA